MGISCNCTTMFSKWAYLISTFICLWNEIQSAIISLDKGQPLIRDCKPPTNVCKMPHYIPRKVDCDNDGILDFTCTEFDDSKQWLILSSEGCPNSWGRNDRHSECPSLFQVHGRSAGDFQCAGGWSLPISFKCDGQDNCGDNSDEENCQKTGAIGSQTFHCKWDTNLINPLQIEMKCNGHNNCGDNSDEENCEETEFHCKWDTNHNSPLPIELKCNGQNNCGDNSD